MAVMGLGLLDGGATVTGSPDAGETVVYESGAHWDGAWQVRARQAGAVVFTCVAVRPKPQLWLLEDCRPLRRSPQALALLAGAGRWLAAEHGPARVVAVHPAAWDEELAADGWRQLHRLIAMGLLLDGDQLRLHGTALDGEYRMASLRDVVDEPEALAALSAEPARAGDLRVWQELRAGGYGPLIPEASLAVRSGSQLCAAIAVTEYRGTPLVGHLVTAAARRGRGLGRAVLVESLYRLWRAGYADCHLNVVEDNWQAHRLYRSVGFNWRLPVLRVSSMTGGGRHDGC